MDEGLGIFIFIIDVSSYRSSKKKKKCKKYEGCNIILGSKEKLKMQEQDTCEVYKLLGKYKKTI